MYFHILLIYIDFVLSDDMHYEFECSGEGLFSDNSDCTYFYQCTSGTPYRQKCYPGLHFDVVTKTCTWKGQAHCGPYTVPQVNNTEIDIFNNGSAFFTQAPFCELGLSPCASRDACIEPSQFCDGPPDCPLGTDELFCDQSVESFLVPECNPNECVLPDCFCSSDGTKIPGGLAVNEVPQIVLLTFDDAVNSLNQRAYSHIFNKNRTNPNGCPITGTFFVSHEYTDYYLVQKLHAEGHEIASHSISHRMPQYWWFNITKEDLTEEMIGQIEILNTFADIPITDVIGVRIPFLQVAGNNLFEMMLENNILYDSSMVVPPFHEPVWPYTLDFRMPHKCVARWCPTESFPGVWEVPLNQQEGIDGVTCAMINQCTFPTTVNDSLNFLNQSFNRHYNSNRAPLGFYFHTEWLKYEKNLAGLIQFLDYILQNKNIWVIPISKALQWIKSPTVASEVNFFSPWQCSNKSNEVCKTPYVCNFVFNDTDHFLKTCSSCPNLYPWTKHPKGDY